MRIYYRRPKNEVEGTDSNRAMTRRDWMKLFGIGGLVIAGGYGISKLIEYNPQEIEKMCNEVMRRNNDPDAVENIEERIARLTKELEDRVEYAKPIRTFDELNSMREHLDEDYRLECDVKCPKGHNWEPIGTPEKPFIGTFNGQGHTIYDLRAEWPDRDCIGMFGYISSNNKFMTSIGNLNSKKIKVRGRNNVGKIVGYNKGFLYNCYLEGENEGVFSIGGAVGSNFGILSKVSNKGLVKGDGAGGLAGYNIGYLVDCFPNQEVIGKETGTLIGWNHVEPFGTEDFSEHIINSPGTIGLDTSPERK